MAFETGTRIGPYDRIGTALPTWLRVAWDDGSVVVVASSPPADRIAVLEDKVEVLADRVGTLDRTLSAFQAETHAFQAETRAEFVAVRSEMRTGFATLREEIGDTRRYMRVLHEEVLDRIRMLGEGG